MGKRLSDEELTQIWSSGKLTEEEFNDLTINSKPSLWAETYLFNPDLPGERLNLHWYQKQVLDDPSPLKCLRFGRGTGKSVSMIALILWELCTEENTKIFLYVPGTTQLDRIYEVMNNMIQSSPIVRNSISEGFSRDALKKKDVVQHTISMKNGSRMIIFICDKDVEKKIRSQHGGKIFIDESDYIKTQAITAITGIFTGAKDPFMWQSSTPRGKYGHFYKFANSVHVKQWHIRSEQAPHWSADKEKAARASVPDEATYEREFGAEWSDDADRVYPEKLIERAVQYTADDRGTITAPSFPGGFKYLGPDQLLPLALSKRKGLFIGIDWNSPTHGVRIVYLVETIDGYFYVAKIDCIRSKESTQTDSVNKIIGIHRELLPERIYADQGYGAVQAEMIYEHARIYGDRNLMLRFRAIDFVSSVEVARNDGWTYLQDNQKVSVKIKYKTLMISLISRMFKEGRLVLPAFEDHDDGIITEMRQFKLKELSSSDKEPIYSREGGQHTHMALALAVLAWYEYNKERDIGIAPTILDSMGPRKEMVNTRVSDRTSSFLDSSLVLSSSSFRGPFSSRGSSSSRRSKLL